VYRLQGVKINDKHIGVIVKQMLQGWVRAHGDDPAHAFPGEGQQKPEVAEVTRLRREVARLKMERDILKKAPAYFAKESM
jgi:transposase